MTRDELKAQLVEALSAVTGTDGLDDEEERMAGAVLEVVAEHIWSGMVYEVPNPEGGDEPAHEFQTWRRRADDLFVRLMQAQGPA